jgi:2-polyprenyl-3-methyl-5-hydroxy-6-metoxy-1,4-benzoquinol methylase
MPKSTARHDSLTVAETARLSSEIFSDVRGLIGYKQRLRPYICPIHALVGFVPPGATVLDVGCGAGLFIFILARLNRIRSAVGFDSDRAAIRAAQTLTSELHASLYIHFEHHSAHEVWPDGHFDVVSLIDVMHHVAPNRQHGLITRAAEHVREGGILLYKDMARTPVWRALANRLHDLISAREWISYVKLKDVVEWAEVAGLHLESEGAMNMLWYGHEWCIFRRSNVLKGQ